MIQEFLLRERTIVMEKKKKLNSSFVMFVSMLVFMFVLNGCAVVDEVNKTTEYPKEVMKHIELSQNFVEETKKIIDQGNFDQSTQKQLIEQLELERDQILYFNKIEPPVIFEGLHAEIVELNLTFLPPIDGSITKLEQEEIVPAELKKSLEAMSSDVENLTGLLNKVQELAP
jgi:hypothetical protein